MVCRQTHLSPFLDVIPEATSFLFEVIAARAAALPAYAVLRLSTAEHRPFDEPLHHGQPPSFSGHRPSAEDPFFSERLRHGEDRSFHERHRHHEPMRACETLDRPNDAGNDLDTTLVCSNDDYDPTPSSGHGSRRSGSDDILEADREYNQVV